MSADTVDGTARGAWRLAHWGEPVAVQALAGVDDAQLRAPLQQYQAQWLGRISR